MCLCKRAVVVEVFCKKILVKKAKRPFVALFPKPDQKTLM